MLRNRHGASASQRPPTMFESTVVIKKRSVSPHNTLPRGRSLTDPDLLLHMQSPSSYSSHQSTVRSLASLRPHVETSDFAVPLIPTIRADSPISIHSRDPHAGDDFEPPKLWKTTSRGSQPNSPSVESAGRSPTPNAARGHSPTPNAVRGRSPTPSSVPTNVPSAYTVRLKTSSGGGEASGGRLQRKKSNASLLVKRGLTRMGSVMSRRVASASGKEGSKHGHHGSMSTPSRRRLPRNSSLTLDDLMEEPESSASPSARRRAQSPLQPLLPSQICQNRAETGVSRPFNVQHQLHVTENLEGLPLEWLDQLKAQGMSESELLLIVAAHKKQRSVPLQPITPAARRKPVPSFGASARSTPSPSRSPRNVSGALESVEEHVSVILRSPKKQGRPSHELAEPVETRKAPKEKPSLTIQVPPRQRSKVQLEQGHLSPPSEETRDESTPIPLASLTGSETTDARPRAASNAAQAPANAPNGSTAPASEAASESRPEPSPQPAAAPARSASSASLPPTPTSITVNSKGGRRSRALSTHLKRSSSIISKLLTEIDAGSSRPSRHGGHHLRIHSRSENTHVAEPGTGEKRNGGEPCCASDGNEGTFLDVDSIASAVRRMSDEIRGFQNLSIDLTDGDEWAASILAAWDEEGCLEELLEEAEEAGETEQAAPVEVAPVPPTTAGTDAPEVDYVPEEAEIRVVKPLIRKQASMISLRALMEDADERKERPRPKSISLDRVYSPPPPPRPLRIASPETAPPSEPTLVVPTTSSSRLRCVSMDSFGVQRRNSQTSTASPSSSEVDLSTPPLDETAADVIDLPKPMTQPLRIASPSPRSSPTPPLRILRSPKSSMYRSSSGQSSNVSLYRSRPSSQASKRDVHLSPSALCLSHARLSLQSKASGPAEVPPRNGTRSPSRYSPTRASYLAHRSSPPRPPPNRPPPDVPRSNTETTEGTSTITPHAQAFPSSGSFLPFSEGEVHSPAEVSSNDHRPEAFSVPTSADSQSLGYTQHKRGQEHIRGQESIQSIESLFAASGALGLVLNLEGVNNRLSDGGAALSRVSSCSSANYSYQLHEATVQRAYTRVLRRARESVHDLGGDVDEVSSESAYGDDPSVEHEHEHDHEHEQPTRMHPGHRSIPSGPTGVTPVDGVFANARLVRVNELDDAEDGYHTAYASPRFEPNRMSNISGYSSTVYHSASSAIDSDFQFAHPPFPTSGHINSPSPLGQLPPQPQPV